MISGYLVVDWLLVLGAIFIGFAVALGFLEWLGGESPNFHWPPPTSEATSASLVDHYQQDGFKEVARIQPGNLLIALVLIVVFLGSLASLFMVDPGPETKVNRVIPWMSHPQNEREGLLQ